MSQRIKELRDASGLSQAKFGEQFDVSREAVSQWERGDSTPGHERLKDIAEKYGKTLDWLAGTNQHAKVVQSNTPKGDVASRNVSGLTYMEETPVNLSGPRDLPILGYVKAGEVGFFVDNGQRQGVAVRPENLIGVENAYAVYVRDDSMSPVFEQGYLLHVDPNRPTGPKDNVVIQQSDGQCLIKRLVSKTPKLVTCMQFNPKKEIQFNAVEVTIHLVVGGKYK